jgi:hypothetical protein
MSFSNFTREISERIHQIEGHLEMAKIEIAFENFSPMRNFNLGRLPMRIRPQKKKIFVFFHHLSFLIPKVMRFLTLPPFKCVFEPSPPFECAFEPSPSSSAPLSRHFLSSAPSSPHLFF